MEWCYWLLVGLSVGSFINVVVRQYPDQILRPEKRLTLLFPASHCQQCKKSLRWHDNIPLFSWLILRGKCRYCHQSISVVYPLTEAVSAIITLILSGFISDLPLLLATLLFCWALLALSLIDIRHYLLPDDLTLPLLWGGLLFHCLAILPGTLSSACIGVMAGYLSLALLTSGYRYLRGYEALGMGDAKLLAALGAWLGWEPLPIVLIIACCGGLLFGLISRILWQRKLKDAIAFGPWLSLAGISHFIHSII